MSEGPEALLRGQGSRSRATSWVVVGSLVSGVAAYLFQILGTRALGDEAYAPISVLWTMQYLIVTVVLVAVEANLTRAVTLAEGARGTLRRQTTAVTAWLGVTAVLVGGLSFALRDALFGGLASLAAVAALIVVSYGAFVVLRGWLAGMGRFRSYGIVTGAESVTRLLVTVVVLSVVATPTSLAWTMPLGPGVVLAWWLRERRKPPAPDPVDAPPPPPARSATRFLAATTVANAASQTLLASGPLVLLPLGARASEVSVFFVTVTAARVPLVFAVGGLLSRVLPPLTRMARSGRWGQLGRMALALGGGTVALAGAAGTAGWWLGPDVIALFFGATFRPAGWFAAAAAATVLLACGALLLNQLLIAMHAESRLVAPWLLGLAVGAASVAALPGAPSFQVAIGFLIGEFVALCGLLTAALLTAHPAAAGTGLPDVRTRST